MIRSGFKLALGIIAGVLSLGIALVYMYPQVIGYSVLGWCLWRAATTHRRARQQHDRTP